MRRNTLRHLAGADERPQRTQRNDDVADAARQQHVGRTLGALPAVDDHTGQQLALAAIGGDHVEPRQQPVRQNGSRSGIEDHLRPRLAGDRGSVFDSGHRNLQLHEQVLRTADRIRHRIDVGGSQPVIGARSHHDAVLARGVDRDKRHSRRGGPVLYNIGDVDAVPRVGFERTLPEHVVADLGHELHAAADPGDRHGLIGPLAAGIHHECPAQHRFARVFELPITMIFSILKNYKFTC